jgi:hypothetical protein
MVNTVNGISGRQRIASTMDGKVSLLQEDRLPSSAIHHPQNNYNHQDHQDNRRPKAGFKDPAYDLAGR